MTAEIAEIEVRGAGKANVLDADAMARLEVSLVAAEARGAGGVVLHGPPGRFAAGADLDALSRLGGPTAHAFARDGARLFRRMERAPMWLAAAVDGHCIGGGLDLALACDWIVATPRARFRHPGARFGFPTTYGGNRRLPARVGGARAAEILLSGRDVEAAEAREIGLVAELADPAEMRDRCRLRLARWIEAVPPALAEAYRSVFRRAPTLSAGAALALERTVFQVARSC